MVKPVKGFRLDKNLIESLEDKSDQKGISLNAMVNNVLENYDSIYYHLEQNHYQWVSPAFMGQIALILSDSQLKKLSGILSQDLKNQTKYSFGKVNSDTIAKFLQRTLAIQNLTIKNEHVDKSTKYTIFHKMGPNYSKLMRYTLKKLGNNSIKKLEYNHEFFSFQVKNSK